MSLFLVSLSSSSADVSTGQAAASADVVRVWETPGDDPDYLVVRVARQRTVSGLAEETGLPVHAAKRIVLEGAEEDSDESLEAALPFSAPEDLPRYDFLAWIDPPLAWCDWCPGFHKPGEHTRPQ